MDLVAEIDRAVLELPENLQVVWMRFRSLACSTATAWQSVRDNKPAMYLFGWGGQVLFGEHAFAADLYWPSDKSYAARKGTVSGGALEVAHGITEFFQEMTRA